MILKSEVIQLNLSKLEQAKQDFTILNDYANTDDSQILRKLWDDARPYGLMSYLNFIDFIRYATKNNQQIFYTKKIHLSEFKEILVKGAIDPSVKKILKSKGKISFAKLINSPKWEFYSGNKRKRGGVRCQDNFLFSSAMIANFCIQNEIDIQETSRISEFYTRILPDIDVSLKREIDLTVDIIDFMIDNLSKSGYDFRRLNVEHISKFITDEFRKKLLSIESGEAVKMIEETDYYGGLTIGQTYKVLDKEISSGRLNVVIENDVKLRRSYPYRIFETITNLRNSALDDLLDL